MSSRHSPDPVRATREMVGYLTRRAVGAVVVVLALLVLLALMVHVVPGDPLRAILGVRARNPELVELARQEMRLDEPMLSQVWHQIVDAVRGDFGRDFLSRRPVTAIIGEALPHTLLLGTLAFILILILGVPLGIIAASRPNGWLDRLIGMVSISLIAVPAYVVALILLLVLGISFQVFPVIGTGELRDPVDYLAHLLLPAVALAAGVVGYLAMLVRTSMLEVLNLPYIRSARAVGLKERQVFFKYAFRNAVLPVVAFLGLMAGYLLGGAIFVELIFSRPGLGRLVTQAISTRNYPVFRGSVVVLAIIYIAANTGADVLLRYLDRRIR